MKDISFTHMLNRPDIEGLCSIAIETFHSLCGFSANSHDTSQHTMYGLIRTMVRLTAKQERAEKQRYEEAKAALIKELDEYLAADSHSLTTPAQAGSAAIIVDGLEKHIQKSLKNQNIPHKTGYGATFYKGH